MSLAAALPSISPRDASARIEIGLTLTNASSALGSVSGSTNTLLRKVSGKIAMNPAFMTALGERSSSPSVVNTHDRPKANTIVRASAATTPGHARVGTEAEDDAEHDDHGAGDQVADAVAEQGADAAARAARSAASGSGRRRPW